MAKIEISPLCTGDSGTTLGVKNSLEIHRSISYGFRDIDTFHFPRKSKMAARSGEKKSKMAAESSLKFPSFAQETVVPPCGQKFARNRSISYDFRGNDTFSFSAKIHDGRRKWRKLKFPPFPQDTLVPPYGLKIPSKWLYLLRFSRY